MSDELGSNDPRAIWKEQPKEVPVIADHVITRRTQQLHVSTRAEIVVSIAAALFFVAVLAWRPEFGGGSARPATSSARSMRSPVCGSANEDAAPGRRAVGSRRNGAGASSRTMERPIAAPRAIRGRRRGHSTGDARLGRHGK